MSDRQHLPPEPCEPPTAPPSKPSDARRAVTAASPLYEKGVRVMLCGSHDRAGEEGVIVAQPRRIYNGWTVKLDGGSYVGASEGQMVSERA